MKDWTARDWRMLTSIAFLGGGGIAATVLAWLALGELAEKSDGPWLVAYFAYGCLILIGIVLFAYSAILGRRTFKLKLGDKILEATGEEAEEMIDRDGAA